jgi:hypothetical protein
MGTQAISMNARGAPREGAVAVGDSNEKPRMQYNYMQGKVVKSQKLRKRPGRAPPIRPYQPAS